MDSQKDVREFKNYQILFLVETNPEKDAKGIADFLGIKSYKVYKTVERYNKLGVDWRKGVVRGGRREERCIMSLQEEQEFLSGFEKEADKGKIINYHQVKSKLEAKLGKSVSDDYIWDMFKRQGWKKNVPRKSHPKSDKAAQEEYKKNSQNYWKPKR
jgi:transposase